MKTLIFARRNVTEMLRDPLLYVFCLGFPVAMILMFQGINAATPVPTESFHARSLIPGLIMFSFTFVMLALSLLVSKDKSTSFLRRLYTSPMKSSDFVLGYAVPGTVIGLLQEMVCVLAGWGTSAIFGDAYFGVGEAVLLLLSQIPMLLICVFLGILFGTLLNDKSAPAITSVLITGAGILGGAWMPLDTMGDLETFCKILPFYPSVVIGRIITGAARTQYDPTKPAELYTWGAGSWLLLLPIGICLLGVIFLSFFAFGQMKKKDQ